VLEAAALMMAKPVQKLHVLESRRRMHSSGDAKGRTRATKAIEMAERTADKPR
jgi:hypothetical protein